MEQIEYGTSQEIVFSLCISPFFKKILSFLFFPLSSSPSFHIPFLPYPHHHYPPPPPPSLPSLHTSRYFLSLPFLFLPFFPLPHSLLFSLIPSFSPSFPPFLPPSLLLSLSLSPSRSGARVGCVNCGKDYWKGSCASKDGEGEREGEKE